MKENEMIAGIDVSKATLDICLLMDGKHESHQIKNNAKSIKQFFVKLLKKTSEVRLSVCMENTGYYNWPTYEALDGMQLDIYVINPLHLKKSIGLVRGKNDVIDAVRIAKFLFMHKSNLKPTVIPRRIIRALQALVAHRARLVETKKRFVVPANELLLVADKELPKRIKKSSQIMIKEIEKQIEQIEKEIADLIKSDEVLKQKYDRIVSVQAVGKVLAWAMLVNSNEFKSITKAKKMACYAGVVPFGYQSGTSINKRPRVSSMADKNLKKILHLSAMRAIQLRGELQDYYQRKTQEGKNKMLVLNAVRNKIVARICAVVNNERFYENRLVLS